MSKHERPLGSPIEIAFWLGTRRQVPSVDEIEQQWNVSRSTAFRWRAFAFAGGKSQQARRDRAHYYHRCRRPE